MTHRPSVAPTAFSVRVAGCGRPVIFIPGFACSGTVWDDTVAHLVNDVEAHVLTLAGFAGQPPVPSPTLVAVRDQIAQYIIDHDLDRPVLVGHSLGGTIALWVAQIAPGLGGVVAIDGTSFLPALRQPAITRAEAVAAAAQRADRIAALSPDDLSGFVREMFGHMVSDPDDLNPWRAGRTAPRCLAGPARRRRRRPARVRRRPAFRHARPAGRVPRSARPGAQAIRICDP